MFFYDEEATRKIVGKHGHTQLSSSFFHLLYAPDALIAAQNEALRRFCMSSLELTRERTIDIVPRIIMGNSHIESDFEQTPAKFEAEQLKMV